MRKVENRLSEIIKRDRHSGILPRPDGIGEAGSEECGGRAVFYIKVDRGIISKISFQVFGPPLMIALSILICEKFEHKGLFEGARFNKSDLIELIGQGREEDICFDISWQAFRRSIDSAFSNYKGLFKVDDFSDFTACSMSGGVDSSATLLLLKESCRNLVGITLNLFDRKGSNTIGSASARSCCSQADIEDARTICGRYGIPHITLDVYEEFKKRVIDRFINAYIHGFTPNPCVDCNRYMRFDFLLKKVRQIGGINLATGHYARIGYDPSFNKFTVKKGVDSQKDQSYVFWSADQDVLQFLITPLGEKTKLEVRRLAFENMLPVCEKLESQDICFIRNEDHADFIERIAGYKNEKGPIYEEKGIQIGVHKGYINYTIGQRKDLNIGNDGPYFVIRVDPEKNALYVSNNPEIGIKEISLTDVNYILYDIPPNELEASVMVRYRSFEYPARIVNYSGNKAKVFFKDPVRFPSPGQSAVFYHDDLLLGGGIIKANNSIG